MNSFTDELNLLIKEYSELENKYGDIQCEIEDLLSAQSSVESDMNFLEKKIDIMKKMISESMISNIDIPDTDDPFTRNFAMASCFTQKYSDNWNRVIQYVKITNYELMACDGYKGIIIRSTDIPDKLKNTMIRWDVRDNYESHIQNEEINRRHPNLKQILKDAKDNARHVVNASQDTFSDIFNLTYREFSEYDVGIMHYAGIHLAIQKQFLNLGLKCMNNNVFDVYIQSDLTPVVFEKPDISVFILPIRMSDYGRDKSQYN